MLLLPSPTIPPTIQTILLLLITSHQCQQIDSLNSGGLKQEQEPPQPPKIPSSIIRTYLPWIVIEPSSLPKREENMEAAVHEEASSTIQPRPQLALVPVVDHEQPFFMFWYPVHPQIPIVYYKRSQ